MHQPNIIDRLPAVLDGMWGSAILCEGQTSNPLTNGIA